MTGSIETYIPEFQQNLPIVLTISSKYVYLTYHEKVDRLLLQELKVRVGYLFKQEEMVAM